MCLDQSFIVWIQSAIVFCYRINGVAISFAMYCSFRYGNTDDNTVDTNDNTENI
jgi:hypothetical protein